MLKIGKIIREIISNNCSLVDFNCSLVPFYMSLLESTVKKDMYRSFDKSWREIRQKCQNIVHVIKSVRHNLKIHPRAMKISAQTIFSVLSSKMKLLNRYNLWLISYKLYQNDGFLTL